MPLRTPRGRTIICETHKMLHNAGFELNPQNLSAVENGMPTA